MGNILGHNGAPLGVNGAPITCASAGTNTSDATISSNSQLLYPYTSYGNGIKYTGSIQSQTAQTIYPSTSDQTISSGVYLSGTQTVKGVLLTNLSASNIKKDVVVKIGDSADDDRITSITGTYEGSGVISVDEKDVNFIDYDGTILYSYTKTEFANLSAMPANPSHTGLTAQGWNWTLSDAKTYVATYGKLWIGQMYITSSGKTEIDIKLNDAGLLSPQLKICINGTVTVDWGDGSTVNTITGTSLTDKIYQAHTYATTGNYTISIGVTNGSFTFYDSYILTHTNSTSSTSKRYNTSIVAIRLGSGVTSIGTYAFSYCYSLQSVTIPSTVTSIETYTFYYCCSLQSVTIPNTVTSIGNNAFYYCYFLQSVAIPSGVTSIGTYAFSYCYSLQSVAIPSGVINITDNMFSFCYSLQSMTIPSAVTSIGTSAFFSCYSLYKIVFKPTTPPTVSNSNAWLGLPTDCIIYVPSGKLTAYTTASNYPSSSTYTYVQET